ncbi:hypothetical protein [Streptomyces sp. NPDC051001]|uniref:hypothetical protein n=1 Tax=Streptomyces sp. NPDC051001 TaxID=3155795 RepID=UPI0034190D18
MVGEQLGEFRVDFGGLKRALAAGLNLDLNLIIVRDNAHEADAMRTWARRLGVAFREYATISPTIHGTGEPLPQQSPEHLTNRQPFTGFPAGVTFFHADPFGQRRSARSAANRTST